ncbi:hypothetical protein EV363DRAFT_1296642 [Boletus edulis]|nr:hypothetical protein EV363DRAFT_1296642 [Boletus edulis]
MAEFAQQINIQVADLDIQQLADELNYLARSFAQLKQAQSKIKYCIESVGDIKPKNATVSNPCMVNDMTVSLVLLIYVPAKLSDTEHIIVDICTGYNVKSCIPAVDRFQTRAEATGYYKAKVEFIHTNLETLSETIQKKQDNRNYHAGKASGTSSRLLKKHTVKYDEILALAINVLIGLDTVAFRLYST